MDRVAVDEHECLPDLLGVRGPATATDEIEAARFAVT